jgi:organic hydroperoxide reductase OsmC/OhrA
MTAHHFAARLSWSGATTSYETYSRTHHIEIPGKPVIVASSAAEFLGDAAILNPEDLLVAALSSCHFLSYLALAARSRIVVTGYADEASGTMEQVERVTRFTEVVLRPRVTVARGTDLAKAKALHEKAHKICFIANSVNFPVRNEPEIVEATGA